MVARPVGNAELEKQPEARDALHAEFQNLLKKGVFSLEHPKPWAQVQADAIRRNITAHVGRVFGTCVEKNSESKDAKYKGRYVFQGNQVKDEWNEIEVFNALSSSPATLETSKAVDAYGLIEGHEIWQVDAEQAYVQARLDDKPNCAETWVRIPPEYRPQGGA